MPSLERASSTEHTTSRRLRRYIRFSKSKLANFNFSKEFLLARKSFCFHFLLDILPQHFNLTTTTLSSSCHSIMFWYAVPRYETPEIERFRLKLEEGKYSFSLSVFLFTTFFLVYIWTKCPYIDYSRIINLSTVF